MNSFSFVFEDFFVVAVKEWPAEVELNLISYDRKDPKKKLVEGLGLLSEKIISAYIGDNDEAFLVSMHEAIARSIDMVARYVRVVRVQELRVELVKDFFEKELKKIRDSDGLGWSKEDKEQINKYFSLE